jgi:adenylate cyclase
MISPLAEIPEPDFKLGLTEFALDMNLDDMTGIIDHSLAATDPTTNSSTAAPTRNPTMASTALPETPTGSSGSSGWGLQDALQETPHRSEGSSGSTTSSQPSDSRDRYRESINPATNPFTKQNPFAARSSDGSDDVKPSSPASPHTYSSKYSAPPTNQPRRPSQLRNMKMGSVDSDVSASSSAQGRSLQPMWSTSTNNNQPTVFHDPFKPSMPTITTPPRIHHETMESQDPMTTPQPNSGDSGPLAPAIVGAGPAWAAPESWGVEGDEEEIHDGASSSSSVEGEEEWPVNGSPPSPEPGMERRLSLMIPSLDGRKPPPFGFKSKGFNGTSDRPGSSSRGQRSKTRDGRPSTSARTATSNRPGTSGSAHLAAVPVGLSLLLCLTEVTDIQHMIRIYRADGNYSIHTFPLLSTTADIINALSGANDAPPGAKRLTTTNKLYLRERGQGKLSCVPHRQTLTTQTVCYYPRRNR